MAAGSRNRVGRPSTSIGRRYWCRKPVTLRRGSIWCTRSIPDEAEHIVLWLAQRVQHPEVKINHALVLGGKPGIGKDTILEPIKQAVGPWNFVDISPKQALGRFNGFLKSVILRVNEARDLGEFDRYAFYDHMKAFIAAPPDVIRVDEKHIREYYGLQPHRRRDHHQPQDRRHLPASRRPAAFRGVVQLEQGGFRRSITGAISIGWYGNGGNEAVAEFLASRDLSDFDAKAPPPKTGAFFEIANANRAPEDAELADVLDDLGQPDVVTLDRVASQASVLQPSFAEWLRDPRPTRAASRTASRIAATSPCATPTTAKDAGRSAANDTRSTARPTSPRASASTPPSSSPVHGDRDAKDAKDVIYHCVYHTTHHYHFV